MDRLSRGWIAIVFAGLLAVTPQLSSERCWAEETIHATREPWTTSRVTGSPDPAPPFQAVRAFPNLQFERPVLLVRGPEGKRFFVGEEAGVLCSFVDRPDAQAEPFFDLRTELATLSLHPQAAGVDSVYALAFHPDFARNRECYICYTLKSREQGQRNLEDGSRISRFRVTATDPPRVDPHSEEIVLTFLQGGHNGCDMHFGPDGMLYISTGDAASPNPPDPLNTGQDISDVLASILRIDVNHQQDGKNYAIPDDNPFLDLEGARPEVWAYGFRNPWRMSFDRQTGELFVGDVGWELWEMVHRVERGGNYGWSAMEGPQPIKLDQIGPTPIHPPLLELPHTIACSITGGYVYRGSRFPELYGSYVFGDWETRRLWAATFAPDQPPEMVEITRPAVRVVAFAEDARGELCLLDYDAGTLHHLARNDASTQNTAFPQTLSETGLFASVREHRPAAGVVKFLINSRQWQDGAEAEHWAAFPGLSSAEYYAQGKPIPGLVHWHYFHMHFPKDAVLSRTLSLGERRLETQLLHYDGIDWRGYTYAWRDDQQDADLVPAEGAEKIIRHGQRTHVWQYSSRSQCMSCHSNQTEYALAFASEQLNRPGPDGRNQLIALSEAGWIQRLDKDDRLLPPFDSSSVAEARQIANPTDVSQTLMARARGYLHANCGHCHAEHGGGTVPLRLHFDVPLGDMQAVGVAPTRGDFGLPNAAIIQPGRPYSSTLFFRMAKFGRDRMPHIGAEWPDAAGLNLVAEWIRTLGDEAEEAGAADTSQLPINQQLASPTTALPLAQRVASGDLDAAERAQLLTAVASLPAGLVRDLFEGYLPWEDAADRRLGSSPRPQSILKLRGEPARGKALFWSASLECGKCHRVGDRGAAVGPDLTKVGGRRTRDELLESLLMPSRRVEAEYATFVVLTDAGSIVTGLLVHRDAETLVIRDAQGKELSLPVDQIDEIRPSAKSLMPENQMAGLTAQQAADLIAYLKSLP